MNNLLSSVFWLNDHTLFCLYQTAAIVENAGRTWPLEHAPGFWCYSREVEAWIAARQTQARALPQAIQLVQDAAAGRGVAELVAEACVDESPVEWGGRQFRTAHAATVEAAEQVRAIIATEGDMNERHAETIAARLASLSPITPIEDRARHEYACCLSLLNQGREAWRKVAWFTKHTDDILNAPQLKRAARDGKLRAKQERPGAHPQYEVREVAGLYPEAADRLLKALSQGKA